MNDTKVTKGPSEPLPYAILARLSQRINLERWQRLSGSRFSGDRGLASDWFLSLASRLSDCAKPTILLAVPHRSTIGYHCSFETRSEHSRLPQVRRGLPNPTVCSIFWRAVGHLRLQGQLNRYECLLCLCSRSFTRKIKPGRSISGQALPNILSSPWERQEHKS